MSPEDRETLSGFRASLDKYATERAAEDRATLAVLTLGARPGFLDGMASEQLARVEAGALKRGHWPASQPAAARWAAPTAEERARAERAQAAERAREHLAWGLATRALTPPIPGRRPDGRSPLRWSRAIVSAYR